MSFLKLNSGAVEVDPVQQHKDEEVDQLFVCREMVKRSDGRSVATDVKQTQVTTIYFRLVDPSGPSSGVLKNIQKKLSGRHGRYMKISDANMTVRYHGEGRSDDAKILRTYEVDRKGAKNVVQDRQFSRIQEIISIIKPGLENYENTGRVSENFWADTVINKISSQLGLKIDQLKGTSSGTAK